MTSSVHLRSLMTISAAVIDTVVDFLNVFVHSDCRGEAPEKKIHYLFPL